MHSCCFHLFYFWMKHFLLLFQKKCRCFGCLKRKVMLIYRHSCSKMKARCQYSQWTCARGSFNMHLVGKPTKMETVQYIQLMTSMRFTLRGAVVTGDAYFGRFRKSWYIYRLQLLTVVLTHLKESLSTTLSMCVCRGWTTFLSILQAVALRLPRPLLHDGTIIGLLHTLTTACASRSMMSAQRGHWKNHWRRYSPPSTESMACVSVFWINRAGVVSVSNSLQSSIGRE